MIVHALAEGIECIVDAQRTCLQKQFFEHFAFDSVNELLGAVIDMRVGLETIVLSRDARIEVYSGWIYWFLFLRGFLDSRDAQFDDDNIYLQYMMRYYIPRAHDPGLCRALATPDAVRERVGWRFRVMDDFSAVRGAEMAPSPEPVIVTVGEPIPLHPLRVFEVDGREPIGARLVDGWHRLFAARLFQIRAVPGRVVTANPQHVIEASAT